MPADVLLEIGAEEIPASFIQPALEDLRRTVLSQAEACRLTLGETRTFGTPRRLALYVEKVAERSEDVTREVLGPSVKAAFDAQGEPTRAAEKFAEGHGLKVEQLQRLQTPKGEYLGAQVHEKGRMASELLPQILSAAVHGINFKKSMRWGDVEGAFARPVHWIVALFGEEVVPVVLGDVRSGRSTRGHRFLAPGVIEIRQPREYEAALEKASVIVDIEKRKAMLVRRILEKAKEAGGTLIDDAALVDQVVNLVELPNPVVGTFDERHLDLPREVLIQEMKSHQRYFSLSGADGRLMPCFIAVSNTPVKDPRLSLRGYERVLRARLSDGRFFFDEDRKTPLIERTEKLHRVVWQGKLGSYAEKVDRFRALAVWLSGKTGCQAQRATIERASTLAKADLVTGMVGEFPELQGVMGREYALSDQEPGEVALAIYEHYLPRFATDSLPSQDAGALIGLADRLDTLCGIFAIGKVPTGAADPFALRRACLAIIHITLGRKYRYSLSQALGESLALLESKVSDVKRKAGEPAVGEQLKEFFRARLKALWTESFRADVVEAVLSAGFDDLVAAQLRLQAVSDWASRSEFASMSSAFKRVMNIVEKQGKDVSAGKVNLALLVETQEKELFKAFEAVAGKCTQALSSDDYGGALKEISTLKAPVDAFFDKVMVMAEDKALRENRVRLLVEIGGLFNRIAHFALIQTEAA